MSDSTLGTVLMTPAGVVSMVFLVGPLLYGLAMGFRRINSSTLNADWPFTGLDNWQRVLSNPQFHAAVPRTLVLAGGTVALSLVVALVMALVLNERFRGRTLVQIAVLLPWIIAPIASGLMWRWLFDGNFGLVNVIGTRTGLLDQNVGWLSRPNVAMAVAVLAESWRSIPVLTLLFLARLRGLNPNLYKAAKIDGAEIAARLRHVTLPSMRGVLAVGAVLQVISALQAFDVLYTLTQGGPAGATTVLNLLLYKQAFQSLNFGAASVLALMIGFLTAFVLVVVAAARVASRALADRRGAG
ncbi:MAG: ABC transporter permease subunit [Streptosporangiales bacterium]|nr:ABC transporter permease subunit [Streptosporangiales bacterium]